MQPRKAAPPGDSGGIQTHDLQNRNLTLYSAKLRNHCDFAGAKLLQKSEMRKDIVIELSYKGFS